MTPPPVKHHISQITIFQILTNWPCADTPLLGCYLMSPAIPNSVVFDSSHNHIPMISSANQTWQLEMRSILAISWEHHLVIKVIFHDFSNNHCYKEDIPSHGWWKFIGQHAWGQTTVLEVHLSFLRQALKCWHHVPETSTSESSQRAVYHEIVCL